MGVDPTDIRNLVSLRIISHIILDYLSDEEIREAFEFLRDTYEWQLRALPVRSLPAPELKAIPCRYVDRVVSPAFVLPEE